MDDGAGDFDRSSEAPPKAKVFTMGRKGQPVKPKNDPPVESTSEQRAVLAMSRALRKGLPTRGEAARNAGGEFKKEVSEVRSLRKAPDEDVAQLTGLVTRTVYRCLTDYDDKMDAKLKKASGRMDEALTIMANNIRNRHTALKKLEEVSRLNPEGAAALQGLVKDLAKEAWWICANFPHLFSGPRMKDLRLGLIELAKMEGDPPEVNGAKTTCWRIWMLNDSNIRPFDANYRRHKD